MDEMDVTLFYMSYGDLELLKAKEALDAKKIGK
jgi:hypothetical protein